MLNKQRLFTLVALAALLMAHPAVAQQPPTSYSPPDEALWSEMKKALADVPLSIASHQHIQGILAQVEKVARDKAAQNKAPPK